MQSVQRILHGVSRRARVTGVCVGLPHGAARQGGDHGQPIRLMGVSIDITKSKLLEEELKALRDRLQAETDYLREEVRVSGKFDEIIGQSKAAQEGVSEDRTGSPHGLCRARHGRDRHRQRTGSSRDSQPQQA